MRILPDSWIARRAAVSRIAPIVAKSVRRHGPVPAEAWNSAYMLGFLALLISLFAVARTQGRLTGQRLGLTQLQAWQEITGQHSDRFGEDLLLLSAASDPDFLDGCRNARRFYDAYAGAACDLDEALEEFEADAALDAEPAAEDERLFGAGGIRATIMWHRYFVLRTWASALP